MPAGTLFSNGVGVVTLKRLEDALADRDTIYAVLRGAAVNNDGAAKMSFTAPAVEGQATVIAMAQAMAGFEPATISYVEAHGTATPLGDPVEVEALTQAFRAGTARKHFCGLGSIKGNLGHRPVSAAAGVTGLIKTALAAPASRTTSANAALPQTKPGHRLGQQPIPGRRSTDALAAQFTAASGSSQFVRCWRNQCPRRSRRSARNGCQRRTEEPGEQLLMLSARTDKAAA